MKKILLTIFLLCLPVVSFAADENDKFNETLDLQSAKVISKYLGVIHTLRWIATNEDINKDGSIKYNKNNEDKYNAYIEKVVRDGLLVYMNNINKISLLNRFAKYGIKEGSDVYKYAQTVEKTSDLQKRIEAVLEAQVNSCEVTPDAVLQATLIGTISPTQYIKMIKTIKNKCKEE